MDLRFKKGCVIFLTVFLYPVWDYLNAHLTWQHCIRRGKSANTTTLSIAMAFCKDHDIQR
jgi:hypothetical protein